MGHQSDPGTCEGAALEPVTPEAVVSSVSDRLDQLRRSLKRRASLGEFDARKASKISESPKEMPVEGTEEAKDESFMELFAGEAGLTQAVRRQGLHVLEPGEIQTSSRVVTSMNLLCNKTFAELKALTKKRRVRWLHMAPPCRTFSRARRRDKFAKVKVLRSTRHPEGLEPKSSRVKEANLLASRAAQLSLLQWKAGGWFSLENPEGSLIWLYEPVRRLLQLEGLCCTRAISVVLWVSL